MHPGGGRGKWYINIVLLFMYPGGRGSVTFNMVVLSMYVGREALYMIFIIIVNIGFFHCFL